MKNLLIILCLALVTLPVFAEDRPFEISLAPWPLLGGSQQYGGSPKLNADLGYFISEQLELQLGSVVGMRTKGTSERLYGVYTGALWNFSEDHDRAFVAGGGFGYVNHYPLTVYEPRDPSAAYLYVRGGKRFLLSEEYHITYFPYLEFMYGSRTGDRYFGAQIDIFNFSILF